MTETQEQTAVADFENTSKPDTYTLWYAIWTGAFFLWVYVSRDLDRIFNLYMLAGLIFVLSAFVSAAALVISLVVNVIRRRWRRVISIITAPFVAGSFFVLLAWLGITPEQVRLDLWKSNYLAQVNAAAATDGGPRLMSWDWGSTGGAGVVNYFWTLVYDDSDQIVLPPTSRSAEWYGKADKAFKGASIGKPVATFQDNAHLQNYTQEYYDQHISVRHIDGHFYVVEEEFP
jgi:hypothetical protein